MIGGGTLLGLANLLTGVNDFDRILEMSKRGDNSEVDMLVKDIYGNNSPFKGLTGDLLASSFAKVAFDNEFDGKLKFQDISHKYKKEDVLNSLVFMISFNIGQLAYMTGQLHNTHQMYFIGNYVRGHDLAMERINFAVEFMSQGANKANFLTYDGYLGAIGAFLKEFDPLVMQSPKAKLPTEDVPTDQTIVKEIEKLTVSGAAVAKDAAK